MILIPVFLLLLAGWILLAWSIAEDQNLKWLRILCARVFVVLVFVGGTGAGVVVTRMQLRNQHRVDTSAFATAVRDQLQRGETERLLENLNRIVEPPDEWSNESGDVLERLNAAIERMQATDSAADDIQVAVETTQSQYE
jgi:hypothetical protein